MKTKKERYVKVKFLSSYRSNDYDGFVFKDNLGANVGDAVLVDTRYGVAIGVVEFVNVEDIDEFEITKETLEIIKSKYLDKIRAEERLKVLKKEMKKKLDEVTELEYLRSASKNNPELANMLSEYDALEKKIK